MPRSYAASNLAHLESVPAEVRTEMWKMADRPPTALPHLSAAELRALPPKTAAAAAASVSADTIRRWWPKDKRKGVRNALALNENLPPELALDALVFLAGQGGIVPPDFADRVTWAEFVAALPAEGPAISTLAPAWTDQMRTDIAASATHPRLAEAVDALLTAQAVDAKSTAVELATAVFDAATPGTSLRSRAAAVAWQCAEVFTDEWADRLASDPAAARAALRCDPMPGRLQSAHGLEALRCAVGPLQLLAVAARWAQYIFSADADTLVTELTREAAAGLVDGATIEWPEHIGLAPQWWAEHLDPVCTGELRAICAAADTPRDQPFALRSWPAHLVAAFVARTHPAADTIAELVVATGDSTLLREFCAGGLVELTPELVELAVRAADVATRRTICSQLWGRFELWTAACVELLAPAVAAKVSDRSRVKFEGLPAEAVNVIGHLCAKRPAPEYPELSGFDAAMVAAVSTATPAGKEIARAVLQAAPVPPDLAYQLASEHAFSSDWALGAFEKNPPHPEFVRDLRVNTRDTYLILSASLGQCATLPEDLRVVIFRDLHLHSKHARPARTRPARSILTDVTLSDDDVVQAVQTDPTLVSEWLAGQFPANPPDFIVADRVLSAYEPAEQTRLIADAAERVPTTTDVLAELVATVPGIVDTWAHRANCPNFSAAVVAAALPTFGENKIAWRLFAELAPGFTGPLGGLISMVESSA